MTEDFGPEVLAGASSRNLLKEQEDRLARSLSLRECLIVVGSPSNLTHLGRWFFSMGGARKESKHWDQQEEELHQDRRGDLRVLFPEK